MSVWKSSRDTNSPMTNQGKQLLSRHGRPSFWVPAVSPMMSRFVRSMIPALQISWDPPTIQALPEKPCWPHAKAAPWMFRWTGSSWAPGPARMKKVSAIHRCSVNLWSAMVSWSIPKRVSASSRKPVTVRNALMPFFCWEILPLSWAIRMQSINRLFLTRLREAWESEPSRSLIPWMI